MSQRQVTPADGASHRLERGLGLALSFLIYYGQPHRLLALRRLYRQFVAPGDLCFDIGAHVGNRVLVLRSLGAKVVAAEPNPDCVRWLQRLYGRDRNVWLWSASLGAAPGTERLWLSRRTPTVSTMDPAWRAAVSQTEGFVQVGWQESRLVEVTTLDRLIAEYGRPAFCKIDVEGAESQVLRGLSSPLPAVSFEYLTAVWPRAVACVDQLAELGAYEFNWAIGESGRLQASSWLPPAELLARMQADGAGGRSGDIYARQVE